MGSSNNPEEQPEAAGVSRRLFILGVIGLVCVLAGLAMRHVLRTAADQWDFDPRPLPRQGANAPFITTSDRVLEQMLELAGLTEDDLVYDLGCGDGRIVIGAVVRSGCRGIGFDIDPQRVAEARENAKLKGVEDRVTIEEQDIFTVDLSPADAALMYLLPWMMNELVPQFEEMKRGARIVSHDFWIDGIEPDECIEVPSDEPRSNHALYLYTAPLRRDPTMEKGTPPRPTRSSASRAR